MARTNQNLLIKGLQGQIGKQLVFKKYGKKTVVTKYPDMSNVKPSSKQKKMRRSFGKAVAYAQAINNDPVKKAVYAKKVRKGQTVYHFAMREFMKGEA